MNLTPAEIQVLWVVGATERLATLGFLNSNLPVQISPDSIDLFIEIDDNRDKVFPYDEAIGLIFRAMAKSECDEEISEYNLNLIIDLILEYKNNRTELVKMALSRQTV
jgi:hypothetical protein